MDDLVVRVKSPAMTACVTCPLCHELLDEATTIPLCLHTFCRKCIHDMLSVKDVDSCPVCNTDLGCSPINKLRPDHALRSLRDKIFPQKNKETEISGTMPPVALPTKRKKGSLSSPVTLPRVTGRRVASCHTLASPFEEHSPKSDDPSKDRLTESKPAESPKKSGEGKVQQRSASKSSLREIRPKVYPQAQRFCSSITTTASARVLRRECLFQAEGNFEPNRVQISTSGFGIGLYASDNRILVRLTESGFFLPTPNSEEDRGNSHTSGGSPIEPTN